MNSVALRNLRERYGYSRKALADKLYVTESIIQSWEEGWAIINPSSGEIEEMAGAFGMSEDDLRSYISADIDEDEGVRFIDFIDAGIRAIKFCKKNHTKK